ncbi:MAG: response regulator [Clostridium fessum]
MEIYIVEDDMSVISVLQDIIEDNDLGIVCGTSEGQPADVDDILAKNPDMVLIDFLMPEKDGVQVMRELRERGCKAKCIMISQVAAKELIGKAYDAGIEFFISKPINIIEVKSVIRNVDEQIKNEKTLTNIKKMFMAEIADMPKEKKKDDGYGRKVLYILNRLGMSGEKGGDDILLDLRVSAQQRTPDPPGQHRSALRALSDAPKSSRSSVSAVRSRSACRTWHIWVLRIS